MLFIALDGAPVREHQPPHLPLALRKDPVHHGELTAGHHHFGADGHLPHGTEAARRQHQRIERLGLAGAHLALEEAVHGVLGRQIVEDLPADLLLAVGEREGQLGVEGIEDAARHQGPGDRGELGLGHAAPGECDLEDERLVPLQPVPRGGDVGLGGRTVDLEQRLGERDQFPALAERFGQRIDGVLRAGQHRVDRLGDLPGRHLLASRIDRQQLAGEGVDRVGSALVTVEEFVFGVGELELAVEDRHLAGEHRAAPREQVFVGLVNALAEEDQPEPAAAVGERHFEALSPAAVELHHPGIRHLRDDRDMFVQREVGEPGQFAALGIAARVVMQEIADRLQVEMLGQHLRGGATEDFLQRFVERCHASIAHHACDNRGPLTGPARSPGPCALTPRR